MTQELNGLEIKNGTGRERRHVAGDDYRITGKRDSDVPDFYGGADFVRTVKVPAAIVRPEDATP